MGGHHKKNMRAEKAKVKLKGAKLPKGLNVTKTDFKVRKITIREQLKESTYGTDGERQLNLKEQLSRLKHCNMNARLDALRNIRAALDTGGIRIQLGTQLNGVVHGIASLCLDMERDVRRSAHKALASILTAIEAGAVAPFFHIISSYLRCAMTHIQPAIQEDALLMLDVLLQHVPLLVAADSEKIFKNFLEMISRVRAEGDRADRTLTVNMGQRQTTIKWRTKVLLRLQQMFSTLVQQKHQQQGGRTASSVGTTAKSKAICVAYNPKMPQYYPLLRTFGTEPCDLSDIFNRSVGGSDQASANSGNQLLAGSKDDSVILRNYITHLLPLLLEAWHEVRPQTNATGAGRDQVLLSADAAVTLRIVLEMIDNLWTLIALHETSMNNNELSAWMRQEYAQLFTSNFLTASFPHQQLTQTTNEGGAAGCKKSKAKKKLESAEDPHCLQQNLSVVHLYGRFHTQQCQQHADNFMLILQYLNAIIGVLQSSSSSDMAHTSDACLRQLAAALRILLLDNGQSLIAAQPVEMRQLLTATIELFLGHEIRGEFKTQFLLMLCEIVQRPTLYASYGGAEQFTPFLTYLPQLLLKPAISETALLAMVHLCKQQNTILLQTLAAQLPAVLENVQRIQVNGAANVYEGKRHIVHLYYWVKHTSGGGNIDEAWNEASLLDHLQTHIKDKRIANYFTYVLTTA